MLNIFKPTWMVKAIYYITPQQLKEQNVKAVLADLDNTLIAWNNPDGTEELIQWIEVMQDAGIPVIILSNNSAERVQRVASVLGLEYISRGMKPLSVGFKKAGEKLNLPNEEIIMVGDQIMTDILGANIAGVRNILVKPILDTDAWNTKLNRFMELRIMNYLIKKDPDMRWRKSIDEDEQINEQ